MLLLLKGTFAYSFNNNHYNSMSLRSHTSNIHKFGNKIKRTPSSMPNWYYYSGILLQYLHFSYCVSVAMLMRCMPCGQLDLDDSFLQHIFNWHVCEAEQYLWWSVPNHGQHNYRKNTFFFLMFFFSILQDFYFSSPRVEKKRQMLWNVIFDLVRHVRWGSGSLFYIVLPEI